MKTNITIDISPLFPYLAKFYFSSYEPKYCWQIKLQDSLKCNISSKKQIMKFIFDMQINNEVDTIILGVSSQTYPKYLK